MKKILSEINEEDVYDMNSIDKLGDYVDVDGLHDEMLDLGFKAGEHCSKRLGLDNFL